MIEISYIDQLSDIQHGTEYEIFKFHKPLMRDISANKTFNSYSSLPVVECELNIIRNYMKGEIEGGRNINNPT